VGGLERGYIWDTNRDLAMRKNLNNQTGVVDTYKGRGVVGDILIRPGVT
jgi:hypothetical protein